MQQGKTIGRYSHNLITACRTIIATLQKNIVFFVVVVAELISVTDCYIVHSPSEGSQVDSKIYKEILQ